MTKKKISFTKLSPEQATRDGDPDQGLGAGDEPSEGAPKVVQPEEASVRERRRG